MLLTSRQKQKFHDEEKASGIEVPEQTELDILLEDILEREKIVKENSDLQSAGKKAKADQEKVAKPKVRRSTEAAVDYLTEKSEKERELRKEELQLKKRELELTAAKQDEAAKQQQTMFASLMQQMERQQQQQQHNLEAMLAQ